MLHLFLSNSDVNASLLRIQLRQCNILHFPHRDCDAVVFKEMAGMVLQTHSIHRQRLGRGRVGRVRLQPVRGRAELLEPVARRKRRSALDLVDVRDADTSAAEARLAALAQSIPLFGVSGQVQFFPKPSQTGGRDGNTLTPFKDGGPVAGPGGPKDDKVPLLASNGEWVINADAVKRLESLYGTGVMGDINSGELPVDGAVGALSGPLMRTDLSDAGLLAELRTIASTNTAIVTELQSMQVGLSRALASARPITVNEAERGARTAEDIIRMARRDLTMAGI